MNFVIGRVAIARRFKWHRGVSVAGFAILGVTLIGCGSKDPEASAPGDTTAAAEPASTARVTANVATVTKQSFSESIDGSGTVVARVGHFASLAAPGPTRVTAVHAAVGTRVNKGDRLVSFETTAFDAAVSAADANLSAAEQSAARAKRLVDAGVAPRKDLEAANAELAAARSNSVNAHRAQQLAVLVAPIGGVVTRMDAVLGANADIGQTLVEVADPRSLDVLLVFSPSLASKILAGRPVVFQVGTGADADTIALGHVVDVSPSIDSSTRGVLVRVAVDRQKRTLRLGESLGGQILVATHRDALIIPDQALVPEGDGFHVFVVDKDGKAHATPVTVGARSGHRIWITEGLKENDVVVTSGAYGVDDGATVIAKKSRS